MATLPSQLQAAMNRFKRGPNELIWDAAGTPVAIYLASTDITFARELIQGDHPIGGPFEVWTSMYQVRMDIAALEEDSADVMNALLGSGDGYAFGPTDIGFGSAAGTPLRASAKRVILRPYVGRAVETTKLTVWNMFVDGDVTKTFGKESNEWGCTLASLADETRQDGELHARLTLPARA